MTGWLERRQVPLYLAALAAGAAIGLLWPAVGPVAEHAVTPTLALVLYATFLAVPFGELARAFRDTRFVGALLLLNFVLVPALVWVLSRPVANDSALLVGVLLVLLTPCVDYVVVFARLAGGDAARLLAATPVLLLAQMALLPLWLWLFAGAEVVAVVEIEPFLHAFLFLLVIPLAAAIVTQLLARRFVLAQRVERLFEALMVPLMMFALLVVVASQIGAVQAQLPLLATVAVIFLAYAVLSTMLGVATSRLVRADARPARALAFSGLTRNSLVVLPLALALPEPLALAAAVVVTQTLVELVAMVVAVRVVPRLLPEPILHEADPA